MIRDVKWTGLTSTYTRGRESLSIRESLLTPSLWFRSGTGPLALFQPDPTPQDPGPVLQYDRHLCAHARLQPRHLVGQGHRRRVQLDVGIEPIR